MKRTILVKIIGVSLFVAILSQITLFDISALSFFSPTEKNFDFQSSDFYQLVADSRKERILDTNVVIVPIDGLSRQEVLILLDDVYQSSPAVVGLDAFFMYPSENDAPLDEFIQSHPNLIVPAALEAVGENMCEMIPAYLYDSLPLDRRGVVNFNISHPYNPVRDFVFKYETLSGDLYNFAALIAKYADPDSFAYLERRLARKGDISVEINYPSREYKYIDACDVLLQSDELAGKVVLIGDLDNHQDLHVTPISDSFPGVLIHAHAVSTILDKNYHSKFSRWLLVLIAIALCLMYVVIKTRLGDKLNEANEIVMRIIQFLLLLFTIMIGSQLYIRCNLLLELSIPLIAVGLVQIALDFWNGFVTFLKWVVQKVKILYNRRKVQK